jgi:hypothetical protein
VSEKKRGRPRKAEVAIWEEKYYKLSEMRDNQAIRKTLEERMFKAFDNVHALAFDEPIRRIDVLSVKRRISAILDEL